MNTIELNKLKKRILDISYPRKLSHIGSCLTALPIIVEIYEKKRPDEKFVLSAGHAHLAHAVVMEHFKILKDAGSNIDKFGIHCEKDGGCDCSTGSLGQGLPIAIGMALANKEKNVYCLVSDGEIAEGSIWESIRIIHDQNISNLKLYINWNGWGAYDQSSKWAYATLIGDPLIEWRMTKVEQFPFLKGQNAHYIAMSEEEYKEALKLL